MCCEALYASSQHGLPHPDAVFQHGVPCASRQATTTKKTAAKAKTGVKKAATKKPAAKKAPAKKAAAKKAPAKKAAPAAPAAQ